MLILQKVDPAPLLVDERHAPGAHGGVGPIPPLRHKARLAVRADVDEGARRVEVVRQVVPVPDEGPLARVRGHQSERRRENGLERREQGPLPLEPISGFLDILTIVNSRIFKER